MDRLSYELKDMEVNTGVKNTQLLLSASFWVLLIKLPNFFYYLLGEIYWFLLDDVLTLILRLIFFFVILVWVVHVHLDTFHIYLLLLLLDLLIALFFVTLSLLPCTFFALFLGLLFNLALTFVVIVFI